VSDGKFKYLSIYVLASYNKKTLEQALSLRCV